MVCVGDLLQVDSFKGFRQVNEGLGLHRRVLAPNIAQTESIEEWLLGGDVLIMTGVGLDTTTEFLIKIIKEAVEGDAACLVILLNDEYIGSIPEKVKEYCRELEFPLFTAPWEVKISKIIMEVSNLTYNDRATEDDMNRFMDQVLLGNVRLNDVKCKSRLESYGLFGKGNVKIIKYSNKINSNNYIDAKGRRKEIEAFWVHRFREIYKQVCYVSSVQEIVFFCNEEIDNLRLRDIDKKRSFESIIKEAAIKYSNIEFFMGISEDDIFPEGIIKSFEQADKASRRCKEGREIIYFKELGIYGIFMEIKNQDILKEYAYENLYPLIKEGEIENKDLFDTLYIYLTKGESIVKASELMYLHRNTLLKRIARIEELMNISLKDSEVKLKLLQSFQILEYLGIIV